MLIDSKGKEFNPSHLPKGKRQREAVLATLKEVHALPRRGGKTHLLEQRAVIKS